MSPRPALSGVILLAAWTTIAAAQQARDHLQCLPTADTTASVGVYTLMVDRGRILCAAPTADADQTLVPCLRIGRIHVGQLRAEIDDILGRPDRAFPTGEPGRPSFVHFVTRDTVRGRAAYYVIQYEKHGEEQIAYSVQFTGDPTERPIRFSCLQLGDSTRHLRRQLGPPESSEPFADTANNLKGEIWYYDRSSVSVELLDEAIYSIRVWRPANVAPRRLRLSLLTR